MDLRFYVPGNTFNNAKKIRAFNIKICWDKSSHSFAYKYVIETPVGLKTFQNGFIAPNYYTEFDHAIQNPLVYYKVYDFYFWYSYCCFFF